MKPGNQVAFIDFTGQLGFGLLVAIIHRESLHKEDTTQYVVSTICNDGRPDNDQLVEEDHIVALDGWNQGDKLLGLARHTEQFKWSYKQSNTPVPEPEPVPPAPSTPEQIASAPLPASDKF